VEKKDRMTKESFAFKNSLLSYRITKEGEEVILFGKEFSGGETYYSKTLVFSKDEEEKVREFYRLLIDSRTFPQMMEELAEEFFV